MTEPMMSSERGLGFRQMLLDPKKSVLSYIADNIPDRQGFQAPHNANGASPQPGGPNTPGQNQQVDALGQGIQNLSTSPTPSFTPQLQNLHESNGQQLTAFPLGPSTDLLGRPSVSSQRPASSDYYHSHPENPNQNPTFYQSLIHPSSQYQDLSGPGEPHYNQPQQEYQTQDNGPQAHGLGHFLDSFGSHEHSHGSQHRLKIGPAPRPFGLRKQKPSDSATRQYNRLTVEFESQTHLFFTGKMQNARSELLPIATSLENLSHQIWTLRYNYAQDFETTDPTHSQPLSFWQAQHDKWADVVLDLKDGQRSGGMPVGYSGSWMPNGNLPQPAQLFQGETSQTIQGIPIFPHQSSLQPDGQPMDQSGLSNPYLSTQPMQQPQQPQQPTLNQSQLGMQQQPSQGDYSQIQPGMPSQSLTQMQNSFPVQQPSQVNPQEMSLTQQMPMPQEMPLPQQTPSQQLTSNQQSMPAIQQISQAPQQQSPQQNIQPPPSNVNPQMPQQNNVPVSLQPGMQGQSITPQNQLSGGPVSGPSQGQPSTIPGQTQTQTQNQSQPNTNGPGSPALQGQAGMAGPGPGAGQGQNMPFTPPNMNTSGQQNQQSQQTTNRVGQNTSSGQQNMNSITEQPILQGQQNMARPMANGRLGQQNMNNMGSSQGQNQFQQPTAQQQGRPMPIRQ